MLATEKQVEPATHRQALNALRFLYRQEALMTAPLYGRGLRLREALSSRVKAGGFDPA